jgi:hypothetical protein
MTAAFVQQVGRITVSFARLEWNLAFWIAALIAPGRAVGQMVAAELSFRQKCALFSSIWQLSFTGPPYLNELKALMARLAKCEELRNTVTHSLWLEASKDIGDGAMRFKVTAKQRKGLRQVFAPTTTGMLKSTADDIQDVIDLLTSSVCRWVEAERRSQGSHGAAQQGDEGDEAR